MQYNRSNPIDRDEDGFPIVPVIALARNRRTDSRAWRNVTISLRGGRGDRDGNLMPEELAAGVELQHEIGDRRPRTRAECCDGPRPCPWVSCKYNLYLDVTEAGGLRFNFPDIDPDEMAESCALDVADRAEARIRLGDPPLTADELAAILNTSRPALIEEEARATEAMTKAFRKEAK